MDWFRVLAELERAGISNAEVARRVNVPRWKVYDWKMGEGEPTYSHGLQIVTIYHSFVAVERPHTTTGAL